MDEDLSDLDLLKLTASCEKLSEHSLAKAIVNNANEAEIDIEEPKEFKMYPGKWSHVRTLMVPYMQETPNS